MAQVLQLQTLFDSELLAIRHAIARPSPIQRDDVDRATADVLLLPIAGVFAKHDGPTHHFIANPNHALFFGCGKPYRITFPDGIGDESLVFEFSKEALVNLLAETVGVEELYSPHLHSHCLLSPATVLNRELLWRHLTHGAANALAIEEISVSMLSTSLQAAYKECGGNGRAKHALTMSRRRQQVETVKEMISLYPTQEWTLGALARQANTSPYHLARVFREEVGVPVHRYLIRTRLGKALEGMRAADVDLTDIALDAGFASHSHFTFNFRSLFGIPPSQLRNRTIVS
ncbi:MAG TPA: helix-turn-helix transcriptional regulator [Noviherbaspirillum sp.]|nr:helix-turn-helix transcriptional regulator [Noviherbaspirillum sp.]